MFDNTIELQKIVSGSDALSALTYLILSLKKEQITIKLLLVNIA